MTLIERLNSRAWEHRQHRALREEAARRIKVLEAMCRAAGYTEQQIAAGTPYAEAMGQ